MNQQAKRPSSWVKPAADAARTVRAYAVILQGGGYRLVTYDLPADVAQKCEQKRTEPEVRGVCISWLEQELDREHDV